MKHPKVKLVSQNNQGKSAPRNLGIKESSGDFYGAKISATLISKVTDSVLDEVKTWHSRPLDEIYPIIYLDALYINIKDSRWLSKRAVYVALGIDRDSLVCGLGKRRLRGQSFGSRCSQSLTSEESGIF